MCAAYIWASRTRNAKPCRYSYVQLCTKASRVKESCEGSAHRPPAHINRHDLWRQTAANSTLHAGSAR